MSRMPADSQKETVDMTEMRGGLGVPMQIPPDQEPIKTAASYSKRVQERKEYANSLKSRGRPLGGAPPIPEGKLTPLAMPKPTFDLPDEPPPPINRQEAQRQRQPQGTPIAGVGSAYPINQAITKGTIKKPVPLAESEKAVVQAQKGLSPETVQLLEHQHKTMAQPETKPSPQAVQETPGIDKELDVGLEKAEKEIAESKSPIDFDFSAISGIRNVLLSEERRKLIEGRLQSLDIADLIVQREIRQDIPVVPGRFELTLRTFTQKEFLFCLRYVQTFTNVSVAHMEELLNTCKLTCAVVGINGALLPEHRKNIGQRNEEVDEKAFEDKMSQLSAFPVQMIADLSIQAMWFNDRVNRLFSADNLKNG